MRNSNGDLILNYNNQDIVMYPQKLSLPIGRSVLSHSDNKVYPLRLRLVLREIALSGNFGYTRSVIRHTK